MLFKECYELKMYAECQEVLDYYIIKEDMKGVKDAVMFAFSKILSFAGITGLEEKILSNIAKKVKYYEDRNMELSDKERAELIKLNTRLKNDEKLRSNPLYKILQDFVGKLLDASLSYFVLFPGLGKLVELIGINKGQLNVFLVILLLGYVFAGKFNAIQTINKKLAK